MTRKRHRIPTPPYPLKRHKQLPWQKPKAAQEDAEAPDKVQRILQSPSYRQADQDVDFLQRDETRGIRLQLDYSKPELLIGEHGIRHTVVVFGSARLCEPAAARRRVRKLEERLAETPGDTALKKQLAVARQVEKNSRYYEVAREFGRLVADAGSSPRDNRLVVITGGGPGIMEAANRDAHDAGALNIGLNITLPHEQFPNPYITPDLCFRFHYFAVQKLHFLLRARALVAFPGGFGTLDELFETLTLIQTRKIAPLPVVLVGGEYWRRVVDFEFLAEQGTIDQEDLELFWYADSALEAWEGILEWHEANGTPLFG